MKSVSIYALTRKQNLSNLSRLECHLSERDRPLKVRAWEINSMRALVDQLEKYMPEVYRLRLFYSFQILRLGKEFDLLQVKENQIVNIELKSGAVSEDAIRRQLIQNRYYLAILGRPVRSYTYISSQNRLVRLTNHDHIVEAEWEQLCAELQEKSADFSGNLEDLFQAEWYLISPLTQPERFLKKEYFLTAQQKDIERQILKSIRIKRGGYYHFSGLPGTGKTLLLYDIAMKLSGRQMVCIIHCGASGQEWKRLHERLRRIVWVSDSQITAEMRLDEYGTVLVDEAHLLDKETLENIVEAAGKRPVIFTSDCEDQLSPEEVDQSVKLGIAKLPEIQTFRLTNRIRTNEEISSFVQNMMHIPDYKSGRRFPHVTVFYANDDQEAANLIQDAKKQGYQHLLESEVAEKAYDSVAIILDGNYFYDSKKYLRSKKRTVRNLFHQLNSAKEKLMLIVKDNEPFYAMLLGLL
ncbi:ATP-binding protein [Lachnospiraceae bacterium AM48-27BH]|nr:ATP-binding protein [Lachnospiraceae bacterium AM48-27BH]